MSLGSACSLRTSGALLASCASAAVILPSSSMLLMKVASSQTALGVVDRRVIIGRFRQSGQHSGLFQRQVFGLLAEVVVGASLESVDSVTQVDLIRIQSKDLRLREAALDLDGEHHLLHLAAEVAVGREEKVARQLHGQSRSALRATFERQV